MTRSILGPFDDFPSAASALLGCLHEQLGVELSAVTRKSGDTWLALSSIQRTGLYEVEPGSPWPWSDTICARMVAGRGPRFAPVTREIAAYREVSYADLAAAYIGVPLFRSDGQLFGTLCAFNPDPLSRELGSRMPFVEMAARLLATLLEHELIASEQRRLLELIEAEALRDALTGLWNRRAWERFLVQEEGRCQRYGHPACVLAIDLDGLKRVNDTDGHCAGDALLRRAAEAFTAAVRSSDRVARLGGDEFGILAVECGEQDVAPLRQRLEVELERRQVEASIGLAWRRSDTGLAGAACVADEQMYECKRRRKQEPRLP